MNAYNMSGGGFGGGGGNPYGSQPSISQNKNTAFDWLNKASGSFANTPQNQNSGFNFLGKAMSAIPFIGPAVGGLMGLVGSSQANSAVRDAAAESQRYADEVQMQSGMNADHNFMQRQYGATMDNTNIPGIQQFKNGGPTYYGNGGPTFGNPYGEIPAVLHGREVVIPEKGVLQEGGGNWNDGAERLIERYGLPNNGVSASYYRGGPTNPPGSFYEDPTNPPGGYNPSYSANGIPTNPSHVNDMSYEDFASDTDRVNSYNYMDFAREKQRGGYDSSNTNSGYSGYAPGYGSPNMYVDPLAPKDNSTGAPAANPVTQNPAVKFGFPEAISAAQFGIGLAGTMSNQRPKWEIPKEFTDYLNKTGENSRIGFTNAEYAVHKDNIDQHRRVQEANLKNFATSPGQYLSRLSSVNAGERRSLNQLTSQDAALQRQNLSQYGQASSAYSQMDRQKFTDDLRDFQMRQQAAGTMMRTGAENLFSGLNYRDYSNFLNKYVGYKYPTGYQNTYYGR